MPIILLFWFAAQLQTSTGRRQKYGSSYSKFTVEFNEVTPSLKIEKNKGCLKNVDIRLPGSKG